MIFLSDMFIFFVWDNKISKIDMENNSCSEFKMRSTKIKDRNKINLLMKWSDNSFLCISADFCVKLIIIQEKVIKIGFLCPYCLQTYASIQHMHRDHLPLHIGPVVCTSCKVIKNNSQFFSLIYGIFSRCNSQIKLSFKLT